MFISIRRSLTKSHLSFEDLLSGTSKHTSKITVHKSNTSTSLTPKEISKIVENRIIHKEDSSNRSSFSIDEVYTNLSFTQLHDAFVRGYGHIPKEFDANELRGLCSRLAKVTSMKFGGTKQMKLDEGENEPSFDKLYNHLSYILPFSRIIYILYEMKYYDSNVSIFLYKLLLHNHHIISDLSLKSYSILIKYGLNSLQSTSIRHGLSPSENQELASNGILFETSCEESIFLLLKSLKNLTIRPRQYKFIQKKDIHLPFDKIEGTRDYDYEHFIFENFIEFASEISQLILTSKRPISSVDLHYMLRSLFSHFIGEIFEEIEVSYSSLNIEDLFWILKLFHTSEFSMGDSNFRLSISTVDKLLIFVKNSHFSDNVDVVKTRPIVFAELKKMFKDWKVEAWYFG